MFFEKKIYQRFLKLDLGQLLNAESLEQMNNGKFRLFSGYSYLSFVCCFRYDLKSVSIIYCFLILSKLF